MVPMRVIRLVFSPDPIELSGAAKASKFSMYLGRDRAKIPSEKLRIYNVRFRGLSGYLVHQLLGFLILLFCEVVHHI